MYETLGPLGDSDAAGSGMREVLGELPNFSSSVSVSCAI